MMSDPLHSPLPREGRPAWGTAAPVPTPEALEQSLDALGHVETAALRWLVRREDALDAAGEAEFQAWLNADPQHSAAFDDVHGVLRAIETIPAEDVARLQSLHPAPSAAAPQKQPAKPKWTWPTALGRGGLSGWALPGPRTAFAAVLLAVAGGWYAWTLQQPVFTGHYATQRGQQIETRLPDETVLTLDTASRADVALYRQRREVRLPEGQAMFSVSPDANRPFDVLAGQMRITVVGTRFSVRYMPSLGEGSVQVQVEEGHVRVARNQGAANVAGAEASVELHAGDTVTADASGQLGPVQHLAAAGIASWREQRVSFDDTPLSQALAELERYGDTRLYVSDPAVAALRVTGSVDLRRMGDFAATLPLVLPVRLEKRDGVTEVVANRR